MEREILYRGKATNRDIGYHRTGYKNGDWVYGLVTRLYGEYFENLPAEMTNTTGVSGIEVDYKTIGQYTGLTDKNGVKIFEGDILKGFGYPFYSDGELNYFAEVIWFDNSPAFGISLFKNSESNVRGVSDGLSYYLEDFNSDDYEVIGNVFDNPEILKGEPNE